MNYRIGLEIHRQASAGTLGTLCKKTICNHYDTSHRIVLDGKTTSHVSCLDCLSKMPKRTFYHIMTNCDCASYSKIMTYHPSRNTFGRTKCPCCEKLIGPMQYGPIQTIRAATHGEAYAILNGHWRLK